MNDDMPLLPPFGPGPPDQEMASDSEDDELEMPLALPLARRGDRQHLERILRLFVPRAAASMITSNDDLVNQLCRGGMLSTDKVIKAMKICQRDMFLPNEYRNNEAFNDHPIRLEGLDFNVSAPHMHATCLEALKLQPGHRFLDVGSGCGIITAAAAFLVGKSGCAVGMDVKKRAVMLGKASVKALVASCPEFAATACPVTFEKHNVFVPLAKHKGRYDRIHVGASCPPNRIAALVSLLKPTGGIIVTPVAPTDLQMITLLPNGEIAPKVLTQVRYGDLELPCDAEIMKATLELERKERTAISVPPSTYASDVAAIAGIAGTSSDSAQSDQSMVGTSFGRSGSRSWPACFTKFLPCGSPGAGAPERTVSPDRMSLDSSDGGRHYRSDSPSPAIELDESDLGAHDCVLEGNGWSLPAHMCVLQRRCELVRARSGSGMRDANKEKIDVPEHFSKEAVEIFRRYAYKDYLEDRISTDTAVAVLHVADYYGAARLTALCEVKLAKALKEADPADDGVCEGAAALLALADETGLTQLFQVALDFIVHNYEQVAATEAFSQLTTRQLAAVARAAAGLYGRMRTLADEVRAQHLPVSPRAL